MRVSDGVRRSGVAIGSARTIHDAASVMEQAGVGALAVVDEEQLVGIVTDRDLVRRGLARDLPGDARVDGIMTAPVVTIDAEADFTTRSLCSELMGLGGWRSYATRSSWA